MKVERGSEENVFYFISESYQNVFLNPSTDILEKYADDTQGAIIVKNLVADFPLQIIDDILNSSHNFYIQGKISL